MISNFPKRRVLLVVLLQEVMSGGNKELIKRCRGLYALFNECRTVLRIPQKPLINVSRYIGSNLALFLLND